ncbi:asparaginase [Kineococcus rhizosphaerae]|uniref:asparaginase n=1 Tax=Kineococcus rhizosphaerae TaxID=559628 RepID=UPI000D05B13E|nr:asparaginase [Kineococcus rhizosphaerae]
MSTKPRVVVLLTGGTIGSAGRDEFDRLDYVDAGRMLDDEQARALYRFPDDLADEVDVGFERFSGVPSTAFDEVAWARLRARVLALAPEVSGVVVTHGTATLEETAYVLHLTTPSPVPVVLVGAQRPPTALGSDAQVGLLNAVRVAASPAARGHGVLVAMDDRVLSARDVLKTSNSGLDAFRARDHGPLGDVDPYGRVWMHRRLLRRHTVDSAFAGTAPGAWPRVEIVPVWAGADARVVERPVADGARGLVVASLPPGMNPPAVEAALQRAVEAGVAVVVGSRALTGRLTQRRGMDERGLIGSDTLSPQQARILLALCLAAGMDRAGIVEAFATH